MATTTIHAIKTTPNLALAYAQRDKEENSEYCKKIPSDISHSFLERNRQKYIVYHTLNTYQNCNANDPMSSFHKWAENGRGKLRKEAPRTKDGKEVVMWHMTQSLSETISPVVANEIGRKLAAEVFDNFAVTIFTHTNTEHIHNHFIISAWDMDGRKWHDCHATKRKIREVSDRLCEEYGLSVLDKTRSMNLVQYTDKAGTVRYYEPTDRKSELIQQRKQQFL